MRDNNNRKHNTPALAGFVLLAIGAIWLLGEMRIYLPHWVIQPYTFLIGIGIYLGAKRNFQAPFGWMIPMGIGTFWLVADLFNVNLWRFGFPMALIGAGIYIIMNAIAKPRIGAGELNSFDKKNVEDIAIVDDESSVQPNIDNQNTTYPHAATDEPQQNTQQQNYYSNEEFNDDMLDVTCIFSGVKKMVTSKNFKGGEVVAIMGGADINLTFAEMQSPAVLDVTVVMGGIKLIIPPGWEVKNNVTSLLGGVEERRPSYMQNTGDKKLLVLKGTVIMGGIDIRNF